MSYFATDYTIHFDDTMAYGSHHFLTSFKFQCAAREAFLFGERVYDLPGVSACLDDIHLFTGDAYSRNMSPAKLGDRVAILLTLEEWGRVSARFCYRVISAQGKPICAGFQTLICADAQSGSPVLIPPPLRDAMDAMREIEEPHAEVSFRDRVLAGGEAVGELFSNETFETARQYLAVRYPTPGVVARASQANVPRHQVRKHVKENIDADKGLETWVFSGQGSFDPKLLCDRINSFVKSVPDGRQQLDQCAMVVASSIGGDAAAAVSGSLERCGLAVRETAELVQVAIYLQNVLGARLHRAAGNRADLLMGHSFGEIAALCVAGSFDLATGVEIVCHRVRAVANHAPDDGELLVAGTNRQFVATEAAVLGLNQVVIAGRNYEGQTVASGPANQLDRLREHFRAADLDAIEIPSPTSFHHPNLRVAASAWYADLLRLPIKPPTEKVYSPIGRRYISETDDVAATLASQFLRPFDLQGAIYDVVAAGGRRFVDCGSSGSLGRLLAKAGPDTIEVESVGRTDSQRLDSQRRDLPKDDRSTSTPDSPSSLNIPSAKQSLIPTIAILAQGCLLPGGATSAEELLEAINQQRLGIVDQSKRDPHWMEDFYSEELVPDRSTSPLSGLVNNDDVVVPVGVDPKVFDGFTRTQRLLCIALAPCIESLKGAERVLCLVGATADGFEDQDEISSLRYAGIDPTDVEIGGHFDTGQSAFEEPHAAVQEVFDRLVRPGLKVTLVDAACASSLYAVALGMQALESYEADAVIAGGVFCPGPGNNCLFSQFRGTTSTGCRPFDANADGVVFSEGSALIVLRRLSDAEAAGSRVSAIVRGIGLSSDGKSSSANVPQTRGQILALERCYANYRIDPSTVQAIEAHGTSTPVGDSTEINTLREYFEDRTSRSIPVHSLKGLLGHAGWAAGTASMIAACQYLRTGVFPGQAFYQQASAAVQEAVGTLEVNSEPTTLPDGDRRIAIDGFGFGGANAHLVIESYSPGCTPTEISVANRDQPDDQESELVVVAAYQVQPTVDSPFGLQFDRENLQLPKGHLLLPDLADDMDVSQILAITLADETLAQIPQLDDELKRQTSVVLALSGKTERGVEATMRVLASRFRRHLSNSSYSTTLDAAVKRARPSGPYTLQCMMPNVSSGRAALQLNLNGPNFVVDSGAQSIDAAIASAGLLLRSGDHGGTKLVIVAAIDANPWRATVQPTRRECAAAFVVTTRRYAEQFGFKILQPVKSFEPSVSSEPLSEQVSTMVAAMTKPTDAEEANRPTDSEFPIHVPVWVESPLEPPTESEILQSAQLERVLAIASAAAGVHEDVEHVSELLAEMGSVVQQSMVAVVGPNAYEVVAQLNHENVVLIDIADERSVASAVAKVAQFDPQVVVATETIRTWDLDATLSQVATSNELCESLFLIAQQLTAKLDQGTLQLWALYLGGWNDVIHPTTGSVAGLLKAIDREIENARIGVISTRSRDRRDGFRRLQAEWSSNRNDQEIVYDGEVRRIRRLRPAINNSTTNSTTVNSTTAATPQVQLNHNDQEIVYDGEVRRIRRLRPAINNSTTSSTTAATPQVQLNHESVVVATGGARGVTAVLVDALLRDYRCTVIALGRSPLEAGPPNPDSPEVERDYYRQFVLENPGTLPPVMKKRFESARARWEAHQTIEHLASLGGQVHYIAADVTDADQVADAVTKIADEFGRVDLLVHGAGVQYSKRLADRSLAEFQRTYQVKVVGLHNTVRAIRNQFGKTVSTHVLTSAYSVFGNDGQHDYGAANETMDRLCGLTEIHAEHAWSSIAWLAWDGVGMTRGSEYRVLAAQRGLSGLTPESGQRVFRAAFEGRTGAAINVPVSDAERLKYQISTVPMATQVNVKARIRQVSVRLSEISCLPYHVVKGDPTLPGAWTLDRMVHAALPFADDPSRVAAVSLENISFSRFVRFVNNCEPNIRVIAEESEQGVQVWVLGDVLHPTGVTLSRDVVFARATLSFLGPLDELSPTLNGYGKPVFGFNVDMVLEDPYCVGNVVDLTGPFDCIRDIEIGDQGRRARFEPNQQRDWPGVTPALLTDAALRVGAMYADGEKNNLFVPVRIGRIVIPLGFNASANDAAGWKIKASKPTVDRQYVEWAMTEVIDEHGNLRLLVEDAFAKRLPPTSQSANGHSNSIRIPR